MPDWSELPLLSSQAAPHDDAGNILGAQPIDNPAVNIDARISEFILYGVFNGSFARGPLLDENTDIGDENPLPDWTGPTQVSGGAITCQWVADSDSPSGHNLRFTIAAGAAGDEAYVEQIVSVIGLRLRKFTNYIRAEGLRVSTTGGTPQMTIAVQYLTAAGATTGSANSSTTDLTDGSMTQAVALGVASGNPPADAYYLRIRVGVKRNTMAASDSAVIDYSGVRMDRGQNYYPIADSNASNSPSALYKSGNLVVLAADWTAGGGAGNLNFITDITNGYYQFRGGPVLVVEQAAPSTPPSASYAIYAKTDGKLYGKNDAGTEVELGGGGSLTDHTHAATGSGATGGGATLSPTTLSTADGGVATIGGQLALNNIVYATMSANQNNYDPTGWDEYVSILDITASGAIRTLTGLDSTGSVQGRIVVIRVYGGGSDLVIAHNSGSSDQDNRFACPNGANMTIRAGGACMFSWAANAVGNNRWQAFAL